jgi:hypothetical protein
LASDPARIAMSEISGIYIFNLRIHDRSYFKSTAVVKSMRAYAENLGIV